MYTRNYTLTQLHIYTNRCFVISNLDKKLMIKIILLIICSKISQKMTIIARIYRNASKYKYWTSCCQRKL